MSIIQHNTESTTPRYTTILHDVRIRLGLNFEEYVMCDLIYHLSHNQESANPGWCYASRGWMVDAIGIPERTIKRIISKLVKLGLVVRKRGDQSQLKTTPLWYDTAVVMPYSKSSGQNGTSPTPNRAKMARGSGQNGPHIIIDNNNNNIDNKAFGYPSDTPKGSEVPATQETSSLIEDFSFSMDGRTQGDIPPSGDGATSAGPADSVASTIGPSWKRVETPADKKRSKGRKHPWQYPSYLENVEKEVLAQLSQETGIKEEEIQEIAKEYLAYRKGEGTEWYIRDAREALRAHLLRTKSWRKKTSTKFEAKEERRNGVPPVGQSVISMEEVYSRPSAGPKNPFF